MEINRNQLTSIKTNGNQSSPSAISTRTLPYQWLTGLDFLNRLICAGYAPGPRQGRVANFAFAILS